MVVGNVLPFKKREGKKLGLCQHGFHNWVIQKDKKFDVKQGKLITLYRCSRCDAEKVKGT